MRILKKEIRLIQIFSMLTLLGVGVYLYEFNLTFPQVLLTFTAGFLTQAYFIKIYKLPLKSLLSALITCTGLVLLLRSNSLWLHPLASFIAISSKFIIQNNKNHIFNPTMFGLTICLLVFNDAWLSPGQWGTYSILAFWFLALGSLLTFRARQFDTAWIFLLFYLGGLLLRNIYYGYELPITIHTAKNGSLLLFAFFMITDPRTAPNHIYGKVVFAAAVALASLTFHYYYFNNHGLIYSLFLMSFFVPFLNKVFNAPKFQWSENEITDYNYA